jgi:phosphate transport system permease protein
MHLGFHIFDVGFQSRNSEAGKPMVFVTTMLLLGLIVLMNASAILVRNRLKRKYAEGGF